MEVNIFEEGQMLLVNKPLHWTSFDLIRKIRPLVKTNKVGHAGTLDPLATGLLIICTGKFTKRIHQYMSQQKEYTGTITLGATTPTFDLESSPQNQMPTDDLTLEKLYETAEEFTGPQMQIPPAHSAIKKDGVRLYELARQGLEVRPPPRAITIYSFDLTYIALPDISFRVNCSTGTYIRSLANDYGARLKCGGYLSSLCRTRIGEYLLKDAITVEELENKLKDSSDQKG
ncbi:MAG: tRNA pseudouridine(55) synthase TruB [Flavisolibacter sp.]